ncbi:tagatose-6-phosphate kinase [Paenibacillus darwinianus]|uniref:Tagatose-6-phosphate kinase n=1 Tax=Paenibacillus darwinianus TaxID=1380763 RepID=A0A9W5S3T0_9BACL|nr:1-phosphofructokinase family hexose kinase [Paenibacillus darwinianus]EXX91276.1 tagatose-6-phosphate kinase [Paenibacillus darwinianus]EXX91780.1 tagatose-6-phosphate kinase [Paenibacillus darwinianus]EXX92392.1 tagatose-6-phosphate kinase [Paenibacillus darwinianus]
MITTFTLNAAIDKVHYIDDFRVDKVNRVSGIAAEPGGKGNNVAKVARLLGSDVTASGFLGGDSGRFVHQQLTVKGVGSKPVWVAGQTREALNIIDRVGGTQTEILEPGPEIEAVEWDGMKALTQTLAAMSRIVCFSGSLPRGVPIQAYADLIRIAKTAGALTILDSSGESLAQGLESGPFICKPNREELAQLTGGGVDTPAGAIGAARQIIADKGVSMIVVSLDKDGSVVVTADSAWAVRPPKIAAVNTVGCGDALVAGIACYLDELGRQPDAAELLRSVVLGTAAAASNAMYPIAGHVNPADVHEWAREVTVTPLARSK